LGNDYGGMRAKLAIMCRHGTPSYAIEVYNEKECPGFL
jgi:hypothetical protein